MVPRFNLFFLIAFTFAVFCSVTAWAVETEETETVQHEEIGTDTSSASMEMIAERMKSLSGSLSAMPEPPQLNQVIQIPGDFSPEQTSGDPENEKENEA